jgi:hypothetical protein
MVRLLARNHPIIPLVKGLGIRQPGLLLLVLIFLFPVAASGDGMVIPQRAYALPEIPDQQALLHYANGTETLVIETSFKGQGTNFAWIVPLPSEPKIEPVSAGLFPTLQTIFQPKVVLSVSPYWIALPILAFLIWLGSAVRSGFALVLTLLLLLLLAAALLPALSSSKARTASAVGGGSLASVQVLNHQNAGLYETVTIKSPDPTALVSWLEANGYRIPTNTAPVISNYVRDGWVFAAARLGSDSTNAAAQATHPLAFTFATAKPVYPLRLTGTATRSCRVDLYVFGPGRAKAAGFSLKRCEIPNYDADTSTTRLEPGALRIRHKELAKLVANAPVATKLGATLDSEAMARDAYVDWGHYWPSGDLSYSTGAAVTLSANVAAFLFMGLFAISWMRARFKGEGGFPVRACWKAAAVTAAVGVLIFTFGLAKADASSVRVVRGHRGIPGANLLGLAMVVEDELADTNSLAKTSAMTAAESAILLRQVIHEYQSDPYWLRYYGSSRANHPLTNLFTGELVRFEASPGNFVLRPVIANESYELVWHDLDGAEALTTVIQPGRWRR